MNKLFSITKKAKPYVLSALVLGLSLAVSHVAYASGGGGQTANPDLSVQLGWQVPSLGGILTFIIRLFFIIAGLAALFYLLLGALAWVTSGGSKDAVEGAQKKIIAAVVGVVLIVVVLSIIVTLERIVFRCRICFGISCQVTIPSIIDPTNNIAGVGPC